MELCQNIVILGDLNEDLLNENYRNLRDILLTNSPQNIISVPTRGRTLLDPIIVPDELTAHDSGVLPTPNEITDHFATYIVLPHDYSVSSAYTQRVWFYKRANFTQLENNIRSFDWKCLFDGTVNDRYALFTNKFMDFVNATIPHKDVVIRPNDKPWYDSEIRKFSRKRDRQKTKAVRTSLQSDWIKYKNLRNKVNNLKRHAKETLYNNLEFSLLSNFSNNKKDFWKIVKHFTTEKDSVSSIPPLSTPTASGAHLWHVTDGEKADCLNSYFASVSSLDDSYAVLLPFIELTDKVLDNVDITEDEINDIIVNLDPNKASGPDLISNKMIKNVAGPFRTRTFRPLTFWTGRFTPQTFWTWTFNPLTFWARTFRPLTFWTWTFCPLTFWTRKFRPPRTFWTWTFRPPDFLDLDVSRPGRFAPRLFEPGRFASGRFGPGRFAL